MKRVGVWLDKRIAHIFSKNNEEMEEVRTVFSKTEQREEILKAYRDRTKQGFSETVSDKKLLEHNKHEESLYFDEITNYFLDVDEIVLFGPAQTAEKLYKRLTLLHPSVKNKVRDLIKADSMTKNQIRALIKGYYTSNP
jgi:stalled ribosome rescue protein Dom34